MPHGRWRILGDPAHKVISPQLSRVDEVLEIYRSITAPTLVVEASEESLTQWWHGKYTLAEFHERLKRVPDLRTAVIQDAGHMLHHDQPEQLARLVEGFSGSLNARLQPIREKLPLCCGYPHSRSNSA